MQDNVFIDSNLWVYLKTDSEKSINVGKIVNHYFQSIYISAQVLNEIFNVLTKKSIASKELSKEFIIQLLKSFKVIPLESELVILTIDLSIKYKYSYYDCLIIAASLISNCKILFTEDLQHNQIIENRLQIINPFLQEGIGFN